MKPTIQYSVSDVLSEAQAEQLHSLYQREWWSVGRSLADVQTILQHSDFVFAIAAPDTQELLAFARVLTTASSRLSCSTLSFIRIIVLQVSVPFSRRTSSGTPFFLAFDTSSFIACPSA